MDAKSLHAKQQPLKKRYREAPQSAVHVLRAADRALLCRSPNLEPFA